MLRELNLILDTRAAWAWVADKLKDKAFHSKRVKLNDGSQEGLMYSLFDHGVAVHNGKYDTQGVQEDNSGYLSGGYSSGEERRKRRISIATGGLYRAKMEALQQKSSSCAALLNLST